MNLVEAKRERGKYTGLESSIIPVIGNDGKNPGLECWTSLPAENLWSQLKRWQKANIGLRGDIVQVLDCDDQKAIEAVANKLESLGYHDAPYEDTSPGHRHYFVNVFNPPSSQNMAVKGQFIAEGKQAVIAPSVVNGIQRQLVNATPETLLIRSPFLRVSDLDGILDPKKIVQEYTDLRKSNPIATYKGLFPVIVDQTKSPKQWVLAGLVECAKLPKGSSLNLEGGFFPSRSHLEAFAVAYLMLKGFDFDYIRNIFDGIRPGHYMDSKKKNFDWLEDTWKRCLVLGCRPDLENLYNRLPELTTTDKVLRALIKVAWQFCKIKSFGVSCAVLADYLETNSMTVQRTLNKLEAAGLIAINRGYSDKRSDHINVYKRNGKRITNEFDLLCDLKGSLDFDDVLSKLTTISY